MVPVPAVVDDNASVPSADKIVSEVIKSSVNVLVEGGKAKVPSQKGARGKEEEQARRRKRCKKEAYENGARARKSRNTSSGKIHRPGHEILGNKCKA